MCPLLRVLSTLMSSRAGSALETLAMDMSLQAKALHRQERVLRKKETDARRGVKKAIERQGDMQARLRAEEAIRCKNQADTLERLASRIEGMCTRIKHAAAMMHVTADMQRVVRTMSRAMKSMEVARVVASMDKMEEVFDSLDLQTDMVEGAMAGSVSSAMPEGEIKDLVEQVAEESALDTKFMFPDVGTASPKRKEPTVGIVFGSGVLAEDEEQRVHEDDGLGDDEDLRQRLRNLIW